MKHKLSRQRSLLMVTLFLKNDVEKERIRQVILK